LTLLSEELLSENDISFGGSYSIKFDSVVSYILFSLKSTFITESNKLFTSFALRKRVCNELKPTYLVFFY